MVPKDLNARLGRKELRYALHTGYLGIAKQRARALAGNLQGLFDALRSKGSVMEKLTDSQIQGMINRYVRKSLAEWDERRLKGGYCPEWYEMGEVLAELDGLIGTIMMDLQEGKLGNGERTANRLLKEEGVTIDPDSLEYKRLCRACLLSEAKMYEVEKNRTCADFSDDVEKIFPLQEDLPVQSSPPVTPDSILLEDLWEDYKEMKVKSGLWRNPTVLHHTPKLTALIQFVGNIPVNKVTKEMIGNYKKLLEYLPPSFSKTKEYKSLKGLKSEDIKGKHEKTLDVTTIRDYMTLLRALFLYAEECGYIGKNPVLKGMIPPKKKNQRKQQDPFTAEELKKLFNPDIYPLDGDPHEFWLMLLGLYTGARVEELCKLMTTDLENIDGLWVLKIDYTVKGKLKNEHSIRFIPLHPVLVNDLRFPEYVKGMEEKGYERIFPELKLNLRTEKHYNHLDRWFRDHRKKAGIIAPQRKKTFHSLRHSQEDCLYKKLVPETVIEEIAGRAGKTETTRRYAKGHLVKTIYEEAILKLDFDLDLSHLKNSKYVIAS